MSGDERYDRDVTESDQDTSGDMGVSSELEGHTGPGQHGTTGVKDTSTQDLGADVPPEQRPGSYEEPVAGIPPKAGYPSADPRSAEHPYDPAPHVDPRRPPTDEGGN